MKKSIKNSDKIQTKELGLGTAIVMREKKMKKILGISIVALLAVNPMMASAVTPLGNQPVTNPTAGSNNATDVAPQYASVTINVEDQQGVASAAYVKGAYNEAIRAVNKVATIAQSASDVTSAINSAAGAGLTTSADGVLQVNAGGGITVDNDTVKLDSTTVASLAKADSALQTANVGSGLTWDATNSKFKLDADTVSALGKANTALQSDSALNGANLQTGTVAKTALSAAVQTSLGKADTALQADSALNGANLNTASVEKGKLSTAVQSSLDKADSALQTANVGSGLTWDATNSKFKLDADTVSALGKANTALQSDSALNGANLQTGTVAKTALSAAVQTSLGKADTALQAADIANMAEKAGVVATINSATVPMFTKWGDTSAATVGVSVATYHAE